MDCRICSSVSSPHATATVLGRHVVEYYRCQDCGLIQTEEPYWLDEAYSEAIARTDIGLISRNLELAHITAAMIGAFFNADASFLDYGGGYGMFVRLMRDRGFDFLWSDKFARNLFAVGCENDGSRTGFELVTAFELLEHLTEPLAEIEGMLTYSDSILFSTLLVPSTAPKPGEWWYYALASGQHVCLYTQRSLTVLATRLGRRLYSNGRSLHLLTPRHLSRPIFRAMASVRIARAMSLLARRPSLLDQDYIALTGDQPH